MVLAVTINRVLKFLEGKMKIGKIFQKLLLVVCFLFSGLYAEETFLQKALPEHKKLFSEIKPLVLKEAAGAPLVIGATDENYFWLNEARLRPLLEAYRYSHDLEFLKAYVPLQENILSQRYIHPSKPEWNGWWNYKDEGDIKMRRYTLIDHDTIIYFVPALMFVREVRADPKLKEIYGAKAEAWLKDVEASIRAWDKRDCWVDFPDGSGWYKNITQVVDTKTGGFEKCPTIFSGGVVPYNKVHALFEALSLALEITGDTWYKTRMEKCSKNFRKHWRIDGKHAEWNYRDHLFPGDYAGGAVGKGNPLSGAFIHPHQGYYGLDSMGAVVAWDWGICFTKGDIEKLIQTNLEFMLFDYPKAPKFKMINGAYKKEGKYDKGVLWTALAHFSQKTRDLWWQRISASGKKSWMWHSDALKYLLEVSNPVSFEQRNIKK